MNMLLLYTEGLCNNILILCRKYYLDVVLKELDASDGTSPQTYIHCSTTIENLVAGHKEFMDRQNLGVPEEMRQLPTFYIYWLPNMHKKPIGSILSYFHFTSSNLQPR